MEMNSKKVNEKAGCFGKTKLLIVFTRLHEILWFTHKRDAIFHMDRLMQKSCNYIAIAMELHDIGIKPSISDFVNHLQYCGETCKNKVEIINPLRA